MSRPTWEETGMGMADVIAKRSVCLKYQAGASFWRGKKHLVDGYNGPPRGIVHCSEVGCAKDTGQNGGKCRGAHAEMNAIVNAALHGISIGGATVHCTYRSCLECSKHLINAEIVRFIYKHDYDKDLEAIDLLKTAGIELLKLDKFLKALGRGGKK